MFILVCLYALQGAKRTQKDSRSLIRHRPIPSAAWLREMTNTENGYCQLLLS